MRQRLLWILILAAVALTGAVSWNSRAQTSTQTRWEYKVISTFGPSETIPSPNVYELNAAGAQGWELVDIRAGDFPKPGSNQVRTDYYLKRVK